MASSLYNELKVSLKITELELIYLYLKKLQK